MIKIKVSTKNEYVQNMIMQSPNNDGIWGDAQFFINDDSCTNSDFWIIYDDLEKIEKCECAKRNIWLVTLAPYIDKVINQPFLNQFPHVITPAVLENIKGKLHNIPSPELWKCGKDYKTLVSESFPLKTNFLSVVSYNLYEKTLDFLTSLRDTIDITVYGESPLVAYDNDNDIMSNNKYHIVIENELIDSYWTSALSRCYLNWAFPIYYGGNISNYFSDKMYYKIDIDNPKLAVDNIIRFMKSNSYDLSVTNIIEARHKILNEYNFYPYMLNVCNEFKSNNVKELNTIRPRTLYAEFEKININENNIS